MRDASRSYTDPEMSQFPQYGQNRKARLGASDFILVGFGVLMMAAALIPHPTGFTGRAGRYIPPDAVPVYQSVLGLGAVAIWVRVGTGRVPTKKVAAGRDCAGSDDIRRGRSLPITLFFPFNLTTLWLADPFVCKPGPGSPCGEPS